MTDEPGKPWSVAVADIDVLRAALGDQLLNAFIRCHAVFDRFVTIFDCLSLSDEKTSAGSCRATRNHHVLAMFSVGLASELREGLSQLQAAGVVTHLGSTGHDAWSKLWESAATRQSAVTAAFRDSLAFGPAKVEIVARGIECLSKKGGPLVVATGDDPSKAGGQNPLSNEVVLAGMMVLDTDSGIERPVQETDALEAIEDASNLHSAFVDCFQVVFLDALERNGVTWDARPNTPPGDRKGVTDRHFSAAEMFLAALNPISGDWAPNQSEWIFRGQANAYWRLRAVALRGKDVFHRNGTPGAWTYWAERKRLQEQLLVDFRERLSRSGVEIPAVPPKVAAEDYADGERFEHPPNEAFPLMALAQHHGLPTVLLDWTRQARNAAYFAAAAALDDVTKDRGYHIAVWALRMTKETVAASPDGRKSLLQRCQAPGGTNPNLRAQAGVFTLLSSESAVDSVEEHCANLPNGSPSTLQRLTLPIEEAPKLLRLLSYEGVDGAAMFPGADGVVRAMRERSLWDEYGATNPQGGPMAPSVDGSSPKGAK
jgi:FRG domain-containing protein